MVNLANLNPFGASAPILQTEIVELRVYPIKSCRGVSVKSTAMTSYGLDLDRRWMFVDTSKENKFVTIRQMSEMTLIDTSFVQGSELPEAENDDELYLVIGIRGTDSRVIVPAYPSQKWLDENATLEPVTIWSSNTDGYVTKKDFNQIFADYFNQPIALVCKGPTPRIMMSNGAPRHLGREQAINFPDFMSVLIANEASMRELNSRLKQKGVDEITIERFRPNIIVRGAVENNPTSAQLDPLPTAWAEDNWKRVRIVTEDEQSSNSSGPLGSWSPFASSNYVDLDVQARCARCEVPNVDPETARKNKHEPWDTLVSYRRIDEGHKYKPCFGMLSAPRNEGRISVGMKFQVMETTTKHKIDRNL